MGWIDYKKAFDMVPHSWILRCLEIFGIAENIKSLIGNSMKNWKTELTSGNQSLGRVKIKRAPLPFVICLIPLSFILCKVNAGYQFRKGGPTVNHLLYMDDLKLFGKTEKQLDVLVNTVRIYSEDIRMEFGIKKCGVLVMKKGRYHHSEGIEMPSQEKIREIDVQNGYKYLALEADGIKDKTMKENIKVEYFRRVRKLLKSKLNSKKVITAMNARAVSIIMYSAGIVEWRKDELQSLDRKT